MQGLVTAFYGARCLVHADGREFDCALRGRMRREGIAVAVGDQVEFQPIGANQGAVDAVLPRRSALVRPAGDRTRRRPGPGVPEQVVVANADQVLVVQAARSPGINFDLMDRALALARAARLPAVIVINKMDLAPAGEIHPILAPYGRLGLTVHFVSAARYTGLEELERQLQGRVSLFWGTSGVGKSSLIRSMTGIEIRVGSWSDDNPRGPHTTNATRFYPLPRGGWIADTPGFDLLDLDLLTGHPERTHLLLPEADLLHEPCSFPGCRHCGESGCAVMTAVLDGRVDRGRYARFRAAMREGEEPRPPPPQILCSGDELFFQSREGSAAVWFTFSLHHLFKDESEERGRLCRLLGVPPDAEPVWWCQYVAEEDPAAPSRSRLRVKATGTAPAAAHLREGADVVLRERAVVRGIARLREIRPARDTWKLRQAMKGTPIYDRHALWTDLKPPPGVRLDAVQGSVLLLDRIVRFEPLPSLALGALSLQDGLPVLDLLEMGSSEDELARW
jgi:ribosome biogenesis GTPase